MPRTARGRWYLWLALISVGALVPSTVWVLTRLRHVIPTGDAFYFHWQATFIADGSGWFIAPYSALFHHMVVQSAQHPPLWVLVLALADFVGVNSFLAHLLLTCVLGAAAVFVTGLAAREVAGPRVGLIAAGIAAVYPNYWINAGTGLAETLLLLLVAAVVLAAYRFWHRPSVSRVAVLGLLCALAAITRSEQVMLVVVVLVWVALVLPRVPLKRRLSYAGVGTFTAVLLIAPWVGFNLSRFSQPVFMTDNLGDSLAAANCRGTYYGRVLGYADFQCVTKAIKTSPDESAGDAHLRHVALTYINAHLNRLPVVMAARVGREFGLFVPGMQIHLDVTIDGRPPVPAEVGLFMYYGLLVGAVGGGFVLRRRGVTVVPFVGLFVEVVAAALVTFGATRYRAPLEVGLVVLSAVCLDALWTRMAGDRAVVP